MNRTLILSAVALTLMLGACNNSSNKSEQTNSSNTSQTFNLDTTKLKSGDTFYQCKMNPEVISDKTGNCPKCGMELREMKKK